MKKTTIISSTCILILSVLFILGISVFNVDNFFASEVFPTHMGIIPTLAPILEKVMPSVVSVNVEGNFIIKKFKKSNGIDSFHNNNLSYYNDKSCFKKFIWNKKDINLNQKSDKFKAIGSGVIIDADKGFIVTNNHVVENANKIYVLLYDGRKYTAKIVGKDFRSDIALLQLIDSDNLTAIKIANSDTLQVGDYAIAIGNPYGLGETVTSGIISGLGRSGLNLKNYENFIQTDAAINRGNSGGALLNLKGELIGINTAILAPYGGNIGIGFAIPANMVKNLTSQIARFGQVKRGELGIVGIELTPELANIMKVNIQKGTFVSQVLKGSAADKSGIIPGDIIISLNRKLISSFSSLRAEISSFPMDSTLLLGILRNSNYQSITVKLQPSVQEKVNSGNICTDIEGAVLSDYHVNSNRGIQVINVNTHSAAERLGFKKGDIILSINQQKIDNLEDFKKIIKSNKIALILYIKRGENFLYLVVKSC